jgi:glycosyltransferase involved in cell wall biosynthesis
VRIGFDARYISHGLTGGVRTYVYHLVKELPHVAPEHDFYFFADAKAPFEVSELPGNAVLRVLPWAGPLSSVRNDWLIGRWMARDRVDIVHSPGNYGPKVRVPLVVTLHDTLNLFPMRQHLRGFGRRPRQVALMMYLGQKTRATLARATRLITVSHHARADINGKTGYPLERVDVTHLAASHEFRLVDDLEALDRCRVRHGLKGRVILADAIKNPEAVILAYHALPSHLRNETALVFFSREGRPRPAVAAVLQDPRVRFIARPTTAELVTLMNVATVFAFPSWYEGFGLPLVEAMQCGLPIVASSRGSIPEVVGDAGLIFDLETPEKFTAGLLDVLGNRDLRKDLRTRAIARARRFNWRETARRTVAVYEAVTASSVRQSA